VTNIHPTAVVDPQAELDLDVDIGPGAIIGPQVKIGAGSIVGAYSVLEGDISLGRNNRIYPHAVLGTPPQDLKYRDEPTRLEIGDNNLIREFVTIHRGTPQGEQVTKIGSNVFLMAYCHIAHDNLLEDHVVVANGVQIGGHVHLGEHAVVGGCSAIHQFVRVGAHAFIGGGSIIVMDVPPFCRATGNRAHIHGLNVVGLKRRGFSDQDLKILKQAYRITFHSDYLVEEATQKMEQDLLPECSAVGLLSDFLRTSSRGITR
jgi:UDP-N-acetylglucosamine acyltransferase